MFILATFICSHEKKLWSFQMGLVRASAVPTSTQLQYGSHLLLLFALENEGERTRIKKKLFAYGIEEILDFYFYFIFVGIGNGVSEMSICTVLCVTDSEMDKEFLHGQIIAFIKVCLLNIRIMEK